MITKSRGLCLRLIIFAGSNGPAGELHLRFPQICGYKLLKTMELIRRAPARKARGPADECSVDCETIEEARAAGAFERYLAASLCGIRGIPGRAIADSIRMADLR